MPNEEYYKLKEHIDNSSNELGIQTYNNKVYSSNLESNERFEEKLVEVFIKI